MKRFLILLFLAIAGCSKDSDPVTPPPTPIVKYTLTVTAGEGGSVNSSGGQYDKGTTVSVTATPNSGYLFQGWSDGNTDNPRTLEVSSNLSITAVFACNMFEPSQINLTTSHYKRHFVPFDDFYKKLNLDWRYLLLARGYLNINGNEIPDQVISSTKWPGEEKGSLFILIDNTVVQKVDDFQVHSRKLLVSDFNSDGIDDVFILDQGLDQSPNFGGGNNQKLLLFDQNGGYNEINFPELGILHGGASGDIDNDGDVDIIAVNNKGPEYKFINDGNGNFSVQNLFPGRDLQEYFTAELYDVNSDGNLDLIIGGHEWIKDDFLEKNIDFGGVYQNLIFWGNGTGNFDPGNFLMLPEVPDWGTIADFDFYDLDFDGTEELIVNRTGGNKFAGMDNEGDMENGFYENYYIQILKKEGESFIEFSNIISPENWPKLHWLDWLDIYDLDGDCLPDIVPDDQEINYTQSVEYSQYRPGDLDGFKRIYFKGDGGGGFNFSTYN